MLLATSTSQNQCGFFPDCAEAAHRGWDVGRPQNPAGVGDSATQPVQRQFADTRSEVQGGGWGRGTVLIFSGSAGREVCMLKWVVGLLFGCSSLQGSAGPCHSP